MQPALRNIAFSSRIFLGTHEFGQDAYHLNIKKLYPMNIRVSIYVESLSYHNPLSSIDLNSLLITIQHSSEKAETKSG